MKRTALGGGMSPTTRSIKQRLYTFRGFQETFLLSMSHVLRRLLLMLLTNVPFS